MFFSQDILQRRGGKFGIIWLAATKCRSVSISRRDYLTVCIPKTCDDIVKYICLEAQPLKRHGARPRLSLYLSSQLMFGVASVYRKQVQYLSAEVQDLYMRFGTAKLTMQTFEGTDLASIKLKKSYKTNEFCTLQDPINDTEDSDFGILRFQKVHDVDPSQLPYIEFIQDLSQLFPVFAASDQSESPRLTAMEEMLYRSPHTVSSTSEISMKEIPEPLTFMVPGETDLALDEPVVEDFMEHIHQLTTGIPSESKELHSERGVSDRLERDKSSDQKDSTRMVDDVAVTLPQLSGSFESSPQGILQTQLEKEMPTLHPEPETPKLRTQIPVLRLSPLLSPPEPSPARQHGRRRQLLFSDVVDDCTKLSKEYIRNNMATSNNLCYTADEVLPSVPALTAKELLQMPGRRSITRSKTLIALWKKKAVPYKAPESTQAEDIHTWSTEYLNVRPGKDVSSDSMTTPQVSPHVREPQQDTTEASPEKLRDISIESVSKRLRFEETPTSFAISDASHLSESRDSTQPSSFQLEPGTARQKRRLTEQSIEEEVIGQDDKMMMAVPDDMPLISEPGYLDTLHDIPESKSPEISTSEEEHLVNIPHPNVIREIAELTAADGTITFRDLVPLATSCSIAAKVFSVCLDYAAMKLIQVQQQLAYGDIYIRRGPLF